MLRTHNCGELRKKDIKSNVILSGWAHKIRDKGKVIWIDIRDRYGITQLIFEEEFSGKNIFELAKFGCINFHVHFYFRHTRNKVRL